MMELLKMMKQNTQKRLSHGDKDFQKFCKIWIHMDLKDWHREF